MKQQANDNLHVVDETGRADYLMGDGPDAKIESAATSVTGGDSYSSEEETGWLGGIGADFRTLAVSLKETAGGVANFVHRSAINVANEIALLEEEGGVGQQGSGACVEPLHLPWEIKNDSGIFEENQELRQLIMDVSKAEASFLEPFPSAKTRDEDDDPEFVLDEPRVEIIRLLLKQDSQLSTMHARLSGRSDVREATFWRNYFHACSETRINFLAREIEHLEALDDDKSQASPNSLVPDDSGKDSSEDAESTASSFVCLSEGKGSGPGSVKSAGMKSVGSVVMVEKAPSSTASLLDFFA